MTATPDTERTTAARLATAALGVVGLAAGGLGVIALREATMSTHSPVPPDSTRLKIWSTSRN